MATLKQRLHRKNEKGDYDIIHIETSPECIINGTLKAGVLASLGTDYDTSRLRNIRASMVDLTAGTSVLSNGEIYLVYE